MQFSICDMVKRLRRSRPLVVHPACFEGGFDIKIDAGILGARVFVMPAERLQPLAAHRLVLYAA
jgi:hypothetical protein